MNKLKKPFLFSASILPVAVIAGFFTCLYQFGLYSEELMQQAVSQAGSKELLILIGVVQSAVIVFICSFFGYILAEKTGLWKPVAFEKNTVARTLMVSAAAGILFSLDYWTFGNVIPGIKEADLAGMTAAGVAASVLYGGIIEEILLRLFFMSLISFIIWKLFFRKTPKDRIPARVFIIGNVIASLFFAAGHLPATMTTFGQLTPMILFRCFLLNGGFGLVFGRLFRKYGIGYAMLSHAAIHIVSKVIWFLWI